MWETFCGLDLEEKIWKTDLRREDYLSRGGKSYYGNRFSLCDDDRQTITRLLVYSSSCDDALMSFCVQVWTYNYSKEWLYVDFFPLESFLSCVMNYVRVHDYLEPDSWLVIIPLLFDPFLSLVFLDVLISSSYYYSSALVGNETWGGNGLDMSWRRREIINRIMSSSFALRIRGKSISSG